MKLPWNPTYPKLEEIHKVLLVRQDRIGDVILTLPLITELKKLAPHLQTEVLVTPYTQPLAECFVGVDKAWALPLEKDWKSFSKEIYNQNYDLVIVPNSKSRIATLVYEANIPFRMGPRLRWHGWRYNLPLYQSRKRPVCNELTYNLQLLSPWRSLPENENISFPFTLPEASINRVKQFIQEQSLNSFIIIHPGSGGSAIDLPIDILKAVIRQLPGDKKIVITGGPSEKTLGDSLQALDTNRIYNTAGMWNLTELMALISLSSFFIGNSSGPLHIARAFNVPLLGFYSTYPACHPIRWGPYQQEKRNTLLPPHESFDTFCLDKKISQQNFQSIKPESIIQKLIELGFN